MRRLFRIALLLVVVGCGGSDSSTEGVPRVVNGTLLSGRFPEAAALYVNHGDRISLCSGAWIGAHHVLTAAHCVVDSQGNPVPSGSVAALTPTREEIVSAISEQVLLHPGYENGRVYPSSAFPRLESPGFDLAVVRFDEAFRGVPAIVTNRAPLAGQRMVFTGFGAEAGDGEAGTGRAGETTIEALDAHRIFWRFESGESSTCFGDSGGAGYVDFGSGLRLVGVTSGGTSAECEEGHLSYDMRVDLAVDWLIEATEGDIALDLAEPQ